MASISSSGPETGRVTLEELGHHVLRRRAAYEARTGEAFAMPRNNGTRRTESKKALLAAIDPAAAEKGFRW